MHTSLCQLLSVCCHSSRLPGSQACFAMVEIQADLTQKITDKLSDTQEDLDDESTGPMCKFLCISRRVAAVFDERFLVEILVERSTRKRV